LDNLTHSLVGALLGQAGLKRKTALAMPTLIIAANIPDIDAACLFWLDGAEHLAFRRGITHGPLAMLLLPVLLWAAMLGWDRWRRRSNADRPAVQRGWLLALAVIGTLSHPAMDWLNTYGVRLLEPFSSQWFYGDTLFIIDVWLWAILIGGWLWSRRAEKRGGNWMRRGQIVATVAGLYIFANGLLTGQAEAWAKQAVADKGLIGADDQYIFVASPEPVFFWERQILWRGGGLYGAGRYRLGIGGELYDYPRTGMRPHMADLSDGWDIRTLAETNRELAAYLFWSRMPVATPSGTPDNFTWYVSDQRYDDPLVVDRFTVRVPVTPAAKKRALAEELAAQ
jgi:inner membrane protein